MARFSVYYYDAPWGRLRLVAGQGRLWRLSLGEEALGDDEALAPDPAEEVLAQSVAWLDGYVRGEVLPRPELAWQQGSAFRTAVWTECAAIPWGQIATYGWLAERVAQRMGTKPCARAVGQALKVNPWAIIVPCHRVVAAQGRLGGYAYGAELKASLLLHEGIEDLAEPGQAAKNGCAIF